MSIASIGVLMICLLLLGSSYLFSGNVKNLIKQVESKNQIMVYLKDSLDQKAIDSVKDQISAIPNVKDTVFVSKQEALKSAEKTLGDKSKLLSGFENDNPYPNSYRVAITNMEEYADTVKKIGKINGIESVSDNSPVADKLTKISKVINWVGVCLFIILILVALFLISNSIKIAVFVRRREINIMKFVGATDGFIRWPFVVEGIIIGISAGIVGVLLQWYGYNGLFVKLFAVLNESPMSIAHLFPLLCLGYIVTGILVGVAGSMISLHKYLKV